MPLNRRGFLQKTIVAGTTVAAFKASAASADPVKKATTGVSSDDKDRPFNPPTQYARQVALDLLKPSATELERGLELHARSVVFDAYAFAPRAAVDGDALADLVRQRCSYLEYKDASEDMSMTRCVSNPAEQAEFLDAWRASGVTCIFQNAGEEGQGVMMLLKRLSRFTYLTDMLKEFCSKAATPDDVVAAKEGGRNCLYLTGNGVPLTEQWESVQDELRYLRVFFELGIRMMHLTYNRRNMIGDGCAEKANAGLSDFGRSVISEMNRVGVIVDCAHSGWQTSLEAAQVSTKPMVASHSTCGGIFPHIRSKPDEVIKAIADTGGYIGICCIPRFLRGTGDINAFLDHIDYVVKKFGPDHVAIGTDVAYSSQNTAEENRKVGTAPVQRTRFASLWPADDYKTVLSATQSLAWTNWPLFTVGLVQRGHSDEVIQKIIGGNVMRVARAALVE
ncbi:MAG: membrane dipeptidase [Rhodopirellula sp.]|nr:membrane dipeptidase [Rhodopirellula sp.]